MDIFEHVRSHIHLWNITMARLVLANLHRHELQICVNFSSVKVTMGLLLLPDPADWDSTTHCCMNSLTQCGYFHSTVWNTWEVISSELNCTKCIHTDILTLCMLTYRRSRVAWWIRRWSCRPWSTVPQSRHDESARDHCQDCYSQDEHGLQHTATSQPRLFTSMVCNTRPHLNHAY